MADQSDVIATLLDAMPKADEPADFWSAPIIDGWTFQTPNERALRVVGTVSGATKFADRKPIFTSALRAVDPGLRFVVTQNSVYRLGWPYRLLPDQDSFACWPPALWTATHANWRSAVVDTTFRTGKDTLSDVANGCLRALTLDAAWPERRRACRAIADELYRAGREAVAEGWWILSVDLRQAKDRSAGAVFVQAAAKLVDRSYDRKCTDDETRAAEGWRQISAMDDAQIEALPQDGVPIDDPIVGARNVASIAERADAKRERLDQTSVLDDVFVDGREKEPDVQQQADGVVVLCEVGGTALSSAGRDARAEFRTIVGKPLPVAPVGDLVAARAALQAEFPYAARQIDIVLSDLVGAEAVRLRPTLFVGEPGGGKSRLVRRLTQVLQVGLHRFDGAGSSDNAFGGTPRRWSSGEHCVPLEAVRRCGIANPIVMVDEIDKAGDSRHNGSLDRALLPFLERENARAYPDPYVQSDVDLSHVNYILTANDDRVLPGPLKDRLRIIRLPRPGHEHVPALARGIVGDIARERGGDPRWWPPLEDHELAIAEELWTGGSIRRLRTIVERILAYREQRPKN